LDFVGKRYGVMPSELLSKGQSIDIWIAQIGVEYENYLHQKANGKTNLTAPTPTVSQEELMTMWKSVKENENKN
jgi:hypothetical protein